MSDVQSTYPSWPHATEKRKKWNAGMRLIRRLHLFAGLFMFPWTILYGVTALLFNHPNAFPDHEVRTFGTAEITGTALDGWPDPDEVAAQVVAVLQQRAATGTSYRLVDAERAAYARDRWFATAKGHGCQYTISFDPAQNAGTVRIRPDDSAADASFATRSGLRLERPIAERFKQGVDTLLDRMELPCDEVAPPTVPELTFVMEVDGSPWKLTYNMQRGSVRGRPLAAPDQAFTVRRFLTRLHLSHGFSSSASARWFWAVAVDAMFVAMVFWGMSGLLMWWQIKAVRGWGIVVLMLSGIVAGTLAAAMYQVLS